jgi:A/G-specific adenine glycosylase
MLQQTQAPRVVNAYGAFLRRFPTPEACARAGLGAVITSWAGLGYNRRARHLHAAAVAMVERHGGEVPDDLRALRALPGVGDYTARAVLVFAYERRQAVVDVNVHRVLSRAAAGAPLSRRNAQQLADELVSQRSPWVWNQALIELGAVLCTARSPACHRCPLARCCAWANAGGGADPAPRPVAAARFEGSDRQGRGLLVDAMRTGPVPWGRVRHVCGWPGDAPRARRVALDLVADGLARRDADGTLTLP